MNAKLHYYVENGGDGSASVRFANSREEAEKLDEGQSEPWAEASASHVELKIMDGKIYRLSHEYSKAGVKEIWTPL